MTITGLLWTKTIPILLKLSISSKNVTSIANWFYRNDLHKQIGKRYSNWKPLVGYDIFSSKLLNDKISYFK